MGSVTPPSRAGTILLAVVVGIAGVAIAVVSLGANSYGHVAGSIPYAGQISAPTDLAYDSNNGNLYASQAGSNNVSVMSTASGRTIDEIPVQPPQPGPIPGQGTTNSIAVDPEDHAVFVSSPWNITVIDDRTNAVETRIGDVGVMALVYDSIDDEVFAHQASDVTVINGSTDQVVTSIPVGGTNASWSPMVFDPVQDQVLVGTWGPEGCSQNCSPNPIVIIDARSNTIVGSFTTPSFPAGLAVDPDNNNLYVASGFYVDPSAPGEVSVYSLVDDRLLKNIPTDPSAIGNRPIAFDPVNGYIYAATSTGQYGNNLTVIDGATNTLAGTIRLPSEDEAIAVDPADGQVYVGTWGSQGVTIVSSEPAFAGLLEWQALLIFALGVPAAVAAASLGAIRQLRRTAVYLGPGTKNKRA